MKAPSTSHPRSMVELPAISIPHQGASYNPPAEAHLDLLRTAHQVEEEGLKGADKGRDVHERMSKARQLGDVTQEGLPPGMALHEAEEEEEEEEVAVPLVKPAPGRKTKQQRTKIRRALEEVIYLRFPVRGELIHWYFTFRKERRLRRRRNANYWRLCLRPSRYEKRWNGQRCRKNSCARRSGERFGRNSSRAWPARGSENIECRGRRSMFNWAKTSRTA